MARNKNCQKSTNLHKFVLSIREFNLFKVKSCKGLIAHTEEDLSEAMQRDKKELRDKIESESSDVKRKGPFT